MQFKVGGYYYQWVFPKYPFSLPIIPFKSCGGRFPKDGSHELCFPYVFNGHLTP